MSGSLYGSNTFFMPYNAKRLLHDSVIRTSDGYHAFCHGSVLRGVANILLARIESLGAFSFVALSAIPLMAISIIFTPFFLVIASAFNLGSRIPGISSFKSVQNFTKSSGDAIYRTLRVNLIALPVIFLFLAGAAINIIPGVLAIENIFISSINCLVEFLGPLQTICAVVHGKGSYNGTTEPMSALAEAEEYLRAFSTENYLKEETFDWILYHSPQS